MNEKNIFVLILVISAFVAGFSISQGYTVTGSAAGIKYNSQVCVYKNNEIVDCSPNLITNIGKEHIDMFLGNGSAGSVATDYLALSNTSTVLAVTDTTLPGEIANECTLGRQQGTYHNFGTGSWNITYQWTLAAGCSNHVVNATGIFNATTSGTLFAENTFTDVTLEGNDQLNVTWGIWVT